MSRARDLAGFSTATLGTNDLNAGIVTASAYYGDGSQLVGVGGTWIATAAGIHTTKNVGIGTTNPIGAADSNNTAVVNAGVVTANYYYGDGSKIYYTNQVLDIGSNLSIDVPATAVVAYTQYPEIAVASGIDLTIADGDDFVSDILGIGTTGAPQALSGGGGRVRADNFVSRDGYNAPGFANGISVTGVATAGVGTFSTSVVVGSAVTANADGLITAGIVTAGTVAASTDVTIDGKSAATTGKAIAMAMVFG